MPTENEKTLTIEDLAKEVRLYTGLSEERALFVVRAIFGTIIKGIKNKEEVRVGNFGNWYWGTVKPMTLKCFNTNEIRKLPRRPALKFYPYRMLQAMVNPHLFVVKRKKDADIVPGE